MTLVVIGGGLAGAKAAQGARDAGYDGRVVVVAEERTPPYERPPLSKAVLRGEAEVDSTRVHPPDFYSENGIEVVYDTVASLDLATRDVRLGSGERIAFDHAVVATGAEPRRLRVPGADLDGVHYLRTAADAVRLRAAIAAASRVAVVGAGWIGSEVAASARQVGADVVLVDPAPVPLHRVVGDTVGAAFARLHADHGVTLRLGTGVDALLGSTRVEAVVLADGRTEPADVVVAGIGAVPRVEVAAAAGLAVADGVVVDEYLRTAVPGVYAAGDVASAWHPRFGRHLRVEHWANALNQGTAAGRNAAGADETFDRLPYFYSDQYDLGLEYVGHGSPDDAVTIRGDVDARKFVAYWHRDGRVTAAMAVNVWDVVEDLKAAIGGAVPDERHPG